MLAVILCLTACTGKTSEEVYDTEQCEQVADFILSYCAESDEATFEEWYGTSEFGVDLQLSQAGIPVDGENFLAALESWQAGVKECGEYIDRGDYECKVTNGNIELSAEAKFADRDGTITLVFDGDQRLESLTVSASMSMGEILEKAALNTVLGMGTVFIVLIIIAFIISLLKYIPAIIEGFSRKKKEPVPEPEEEQTAVVPEQTQTVVSGTDDTELIAVISAAIAAAEGTDTDGFVVRSIRRRPSNKWNSK